MHPPIGITLCLLVFTNLKNFVYKFLLDFYKTLDITCYLYGSQSITLFYLF